MADYYPLLARALANLKGDDPAARSAVFGRARTALAQQLRAIDPPLSEADIARERLSLDEAINRLEAEHAARAAVLDLSSPEPGPAPQPPALAPSSPAPLAAPAADTTSETQAPSQRPVLPVRPPAPGADMQAMAAVPMPDPAEPEDRAETIAPAREFVDGGNRERPRIEPARPSDPARRRRALVLAVGLAVPIGIIATLAIVFKDKPATIPAPQESAPTATAPAQNEQKFAERIGGRPAEPARPQVNAPPARPAAPAATASGTPAAPAAGPATQPGSGTAPAAARQEVVVAQRAAVYEETGDPNQQALVLPARVAWRLDSINVAQGQPAQTAIRADIESPEAGLAVTMLIRRNTDATLPAAHLIQLTFAPTAGTAPRQIRDVGLPAFKPDEASRGVQLAGLPVPVGENLFLIGLSNLPVEVSRNLELMTSRPWIDIPYRLANGRRGFIALEKGVPGEAAFQDAMRAWQEGR